ncbi:MAG: NUDIX domain-containing protein, partial [Burkholderiaceae bacterium]
MIDDIEDLLRRYLKLTTDSQVSERVPFEIDQRIVGSVTPDDAQLIASRVPGVELSSDALEVLPVCAPDAPSALHAIAKALRDAGRAPHWRNEQLPVCTDDGMLVGSIERACVRILGIRTFAVHLIGQCAQMDQLDSLSPSLANSTFWLQRRSPDKAVDPNMLDTLAGGLIGMENGARESFRLGLQREISEEAGLDPGCYDNPTYVDTVRMRWQVPEGFFEEDCIVFYARLMPGASPQNRDGEVAEFMRVDRAGLLARIDAGELTETASIASLLSLRHIASTTN